MFEKLPQSKSQLIPDFLVLPPMSFAEINQEGNLCIVRTVSKTNCAYDPFIIRQMSYGIISDPMTTMFTVIMNGSFSTGVFPDSEKYAVVKSLLKAGKDRGSRHRMSEITQRSSE